MCLTQSRLAAMIPSPYLGGDHPGLPGSAQLAGVTARLRVRIYIDVNQVVLRVVDQGS